MIHCERVSQPAQGYFKRWFYAKQTKEINIFVISII